MNLPEPLRTPAWPFPWKVPGPDKCAGPLPKLTVVTPSLNQGEYLEATIRSVLEQGYPDLEYMVVDGGSSDRSREIIEHYSGQLTWWVWEKDGGQTHAIEKGLARATGEWFIWINSDDLLAPGALRRVAAAAHAGVDLIAGSTTHFDAHGLGETYAPRNISAAAVIGELIRPGTRWQQPSTWMRTAALKSLGLNRQLHFAFDYELMIRYLAHYPRVAYLDDVLAYFRLHDASKTVALAPRFLQEQLHIYRTLAADPAYAPLHPVIYEVQQELAWRRRLEQLLDETARARWSRLGTLLTEIGAAPRARCSRQSWRTLRRLLVYGGRRPVR